MVINYDTDVRGASVSFSAGADPRGVFPPLLPSQPEGGCLGDSRFSDGHIPRHDFSSPAFAAPLQEEALWLCHPGHA